MKWINILISKLFNSNTVTNTIILTKDDNKDPSDYTKCRLSKGWKSDNNYCSECKCSTGHNEYMSDICNNCGSFHTQVSFGRSYRKIVVNGKWKYQVRYLNGKEEIIDKWYN